VAGADHDYLEMFVKGQHVRWFKTHHGGEKYLLHCNNVDGLRCAVGWSHAEPPKLEPAPYRAE
jgi:hypothetical protein